jgi:Trefoil (P-type) domain
LGGWRGVREMGRACSCGYLGITESDCNARGCCWLNTSSSIPSCFYQGEGVPVTKAHILVSNHFDCGYTALANSVISSYHDQFFPLAASVGAALGKNGTAYSWLTQSFIVSLLLDCPTGLGFACPNASQVAAFKASAAAGYVRWHAFPHNAELAMLDPTLLTFGVNLTHAIDDALGVRRKTVLSQRDVPGFPLAAVSPLAAAGVRAFSEGSNAAMLPPAVPPGFVWQDPVDGANVTVMFHALGYGQLPSQQVERRVRIFVEIVWRGGISELLSMLWGFPCFGGVRVFGSSCQCLGLLGSRTDVWEGGISNGKRNSQIPPPPRPPLSIAGSVVARHLWL